MKILTKKSIRNCIRKGGRIVPGKGGYVCKVKISGRGKGITKGTLLKTK